MSLLSAILIAAALRGPALPDAETEEIRVERLRGSHAPHNRLDIAILGDGYAPDEQAAMTHDAEAFVTSLFERTPFREYAAFVNVDLVHVVSRSPAAHLRDATDTNALGCAFGCAGVDRLVCCNDDAVWRHVAAKVPQADVVLIMVNSPNYGGAGGPYATFSTHPAAAAIASHEIAHTLAGLADEYSDGHPDYPACEHECPEPNVTVDPRLPGLRWAAWVDDNIDTPTPPAMGDVVGAFEGGRYRAQGVYRPRQDCHMRSLGAPFCNVCSQSLIESIHAVVDPIDRHHPASVELEVRGGEQTFRIDRVRPSPDTQQVTWWVDGELAATGTDSLTLWAHDVGNGTHIVEVSTIDTTLLVRDGDPALLGSSRRWIVHVGNTSGTRRR